MTVNWSELIGQHGQMIFATAFRIIGNAADAEDVAQEVYFEAFSSGSAIEVENWGGWLRRLTVFRALDRRRMNRVSTDGTDVTLAVSSSASPHEEAVAHETAERLRQKVAELPEREGAVFALRYFEQLSNQEIGLVLRISPGAVATALHKARSKLVSVVQEPPTRGGWG